MATPQHDVGLLAETPDTTVYSATAAPGLEANNYDDLSSVEAPDIQTDTTPADTSFDGSGLLDDSVNDLNTLMDQDSLLMQQAGYRGAAEANERGLLNSSMGVQAGQVAALDTVMPLVQTNAGFRGEGLLQDSSQAHDVVMQDDSQGHDVIMQDDSQGHDVVMQDDSQLHDTTLQDDSQLHDTTMQDDSQLHDTSMQDDAQEFDQWKTQFLSEHDVDMLEREYDRRTDLTNIENEWQRLIQNDISAADFYKEGLQGLSDILNNEDLSPDQVSNALDKLLGYTDKDGVYHIGTMGAGLGFISNLTNVATAPAAAAPAPAGSPAPTPAPAPTTTDASGGTAPIPGGTDTSGATAPIPGGNDRSAFTSSDNIDDWPDGKVGEVSPNGEYSWKAATKGRKAMFTGKWIPATEAGWVTTGQKLIDPESGVGWNEDYTQWFDGTKWVVIGANAQ